MKITDCLTAEHRVFSNQLDLIEKAVGQPDLYPDAALRAMVEMLGIPLERHAHIEEEALFQALEAHLGKGAGPLAVMNAEHEILRKALSAIAAGQDVRLQASRFVETLREHIHKEDRILFVMAEQFLGEERLAQLNQECARRG